MRNAAHAAAANAMEALQNLLLARDAPQLHRAIFAAQGVPEVPPEALHVARKRLALLEHGGGAGGGGSGGGGGDAYLQTQMEALVGELRSKMDLMASLQSKLEAMQLQQAQMAEENARLRAAAGSGGGGVRVPRGGSGGTAVAYEEEEDEQEREDRLAREAYTAAKTVVMRALSEGSTPSAAAYLERDVHLYRLWCTRPPLPFAPRIPLLVSVCVCPRCSTAALPTFIAACSLRARCVLAACHPRRLFCRPRYLL